MARQYYVKLFTGDRSRVDYCRVGGVVTFRFLSCSCSIFPLSLSLCLFLYQGHTKAKGFPCFMRDSMWFNNPFTCAAKLCFVPLIFPIAYPYRAHKGHWVFCFLLRGSR